jgi:hypothetical protein
MRGYHLVDSLLASVEDADPALWVGWAVHQRLVCARARGGSMSVQVSPSGLIEVCAARGEELLVYEKGGRLVARRGDCRFVEAKSTVVHPVKLGWLGFLLFPLWHPFIGFPMVLLSMAYVGVRVTGSD